jgi:putative ABC transport system permease protein
VHAVDRTLPADAFKTMESVMEAVTAEPRFNARLLGALAVMALLLTVLGTFGVLAYSVAQRTHEIGVRMALGADGGNVSWMVVRRTLTWSVAGIVLGLGSALAAGRLLETLLFEITPTDGRTLMAVTATILIAAIAASYLPARRATRVDPLLALRHE